MFRKMFILMSQVTHSLSKIKVKLFARTMRLFNRPTRLKAGLKGKNFLTGDVLKTVGWVLKLLSLFVVRTRTVV